MTAQDIRIGQQLGHYRLLRQLGHGGFAEVYLGEHIHLNTQAAVKILHTRLAAAEIEAFRREAQIIARLQHPRIVRVYDFGVDNNIPYLIMDYAPNGTLRSQYPKGARLPLHIVVSYVQQVAEALQYAHHNRLIHRDIKPENMLLGPNNEVLLSDFGIALVTQTSQYQNPQNIAGTVAYMAPEQIQAHPRPASDQYALAVVAYEWLSGAHPFQGSYTEIAVKHAMVPPPPLVPQLPELPPMVEQVIMTALNKDPNQRFGSIQAFAQALTQASQSDLATRQGAFIPYNSPQPPSPSYPNYNLPTPSTHMTPPQSPTPYPTTHSHSKYPPVPELHKVSRRSLLSTGLVAGIASIAGAGAVIYAATQYIPNVIKNNPITIDPLDPLKPEKALVTYSKQTDMIMDVSWSPNGTYIASCSMDSTVHVWEAQTGKQILSYRSGIQPAVSDNDANQTAWSKDSKLLAIGFRDGTVQIVELPAGKRLHMYKLSVSSIESLSWSPDNKYIVVAGTNQTCQVIESATGNVVRTYEGHTSFVSAVAWSPDGKTIASGSWDTKIHLWDPFTGIQKLIYSEHQEDISTVSWSKDSKYLASTAQFENVVYVWDAESGHTTVRYKQHKGNLVNTATWSPNNKYILSGGNDMEVHIWEPQSSKIIQKVKTSIIYSAAWSPDGTRFVTGGYQKTSDVWSFKP